MFGIAGGKLSITDDEFIHFKLGVASSLMDKYGYPKFTYESTSGTDVHMGRRTYIVNKSLTCAKYLLDNRPYPLYPGKIHTITDDITGFKLMSVPLDDRRPASYMKYSYTFNTIDELDIREGAVHRLLEKMDAYIMQHINSDIINRIIIGEIPLTDISYIDEEIREEAFQYIYTFRNKTVNTTITQALDNAIVKLAKDRIESGWTAKETFEAQLRNMFGNTFGNRTETGVEIETETTDTTKVDPQNEIETETTDVTKVDPQNEIETETTDVTNVDPQNEIETETTDVTKVDPQNETIDMKLRNAISDYIKDNQNHTSSDTDTLDPGLADVYFEYYFNKVFPNKCALTSFYTMCRELLDGTLSGELILLTGPTDSGKSIIMYLITRLVHVESLRDIYTDRCDYRDKYNNPIRLLDILKQQYIHTPSDVLRTYYQLCESPCYKHDYSISELYDSIISIDPTTVLFLQFGSHMPYHALKATIYNLARYRLMDSSIGTMLFRYRDEFKQFIIRMTDIDRSY